MVNLETIRAEIERRRNSRREQLVFWEGQVHQVTHQGLQLACKHEADLAMDVMVELDSILRMIDRLA